MNKPTETRPKTEAKILLRASGLSKGYPARGGFLGLQRSVRFAVADISLWVSRGEVVGLVGESGSGKSTLARAMVRLIEPTAGTIRWGHVDVTKLSPRELRPLRRNLQMVFQDPKGSLNPRLTVFDAIAEGLVSFGLAQGSELDDRVSRALKEVGLEPELARRLPTELSGGQGQRVALARSLAVGPELLICDEITSALDAYSERAILELLMGLRELGKSYLFISHDLRVIEFMSDRIVVVYRGRIVETAPTEGLIEDPCHPYTRRLLAHTTEPKPTSDGPRRLPIAPDDDLKGCAYFRSCEEAKAGTCDREVPPLRALSGKSKHWVRCYLA